MTTFTRYANLTVDDKIRIVSIYNVNREMGSQPGHSAAIAASEAFELTERQWNGKMGSDAFAAVCAVLVMAQIFTEPSRVGAR